MAHRKIPQRVVETRHRVIVKIIELLNLTEGKVLTRALVLELIKLCTRFRNSLLLYGLNAMIHNGSHMQTQF